MIKHTDRMLIVIPFDLPWDHTADYTHQTAHELAKGHTVICYMQKEARSLKEHLFDLKKLLLWKKYSKNMFLYYPLYIIPFRRFQLIEQLNTYVNIVFLKIILWVLFRPAAHHKRLLWLFYPEYVYMIQVFGKRYISLYDCVDYHIGSSPYKERRESILEWEKRLISRCSYLFVNSRVLFDIHKKKRNDIVLVPQGFRLKFFQGSRTHQRNITPSFPRIGYVGGINYRLDYDLVIRLAQKTPNFSYTFVGPIQENDKEYYQKHIKYKIEKLFSLPNVSHGEAVTKENVPLIISSFDIAIIPYDTNTSFNRYCYPMKLFEYFYMGKPVISTPIEELKRFPKFVKIANSVQEWEEAITMLLAKSWPQAHKTAQKRLAIANSWEKKIQKMMRVIEYEK